MQCGKVDVAFARGIKCGAIKTNSLAAVGGKTFLMGCQLDVRRTTRISSAPYRCIRLREEQVARARADDARGGRCVLRRGQVHHCAGWHWHARDGAGDAAAARTAGAATTARTTRTNRRARARSASPSSSARRTPIRAGASIRRPTYGHRSRPPPSCIRFTLCTAMASISVQPTTRRSTTMYASTAGRMTRVAHHSPRTSGLPRSSAPRCHSRGAAT